MDAGTNKGNLKEITNWHMPVGSLVNVRSYDSQGNKHLLSGIVLSGIYKPKETQFPSVQVYLFKKQYIICISAGQLEILSEGLSD